MGIVVDAVKEVANLAASDIEQTPDFGVLLQLGVLLAHQRLPGRLLALAVGLDFSFGSPGPISDGAMFDFAILAIGLAAQEAVVDFAVDGGLRVVGIHSEHIITVSFTMSYIIIPGEHPI